MLDSYSPSLRLVETAIPSETKPPKLIRREPRASCPVFGSVWFPDAFSAFLFETGAILPDGAGCSFAF